MKRLIAILPLALLFAAAAMSMSPTPPAQPGVPALMDSYAVNDKVVEIGSLESFSILMPTQNGNSQAVHDAISSLISQKGYTYKEMLEPAEGRLIFIFVATNETRSVDILYNERAYAVAARVYKDPYVGQTPFANQPGGDIPTQPLIRKSKVTAPVEALTVRAYVYSNENTLTEVWESGASSLEGTSQTLPDLAAKALDNFPARKK